MEKITSQKGKIVLLHFGYSYRKDKDNQDGSTSWRCCKNICRGRIKTNNDNIISISDHYHAPDPEKIEALKVLANIRKRAIEGTENPKQIIHQAQRGISSAVATHLPEYKSSQRTIERLRKHKELNLKMKTVNN